MLPPCPPAGRPWPGSAASRDRSRAHAHLLCEIDLAELERHQIAFLDADAMLAGETAADFDTELEDFLAYLLGFLLLDRIVDVVKHEWMQIAVAGMEDIGDAQARSATISFNRCSTCGSLPVGIVPSMQM